MPAFTRDELSDGSVDMLRTRARRYELVPYGLAVGHLSTPPHRSLLQCVSILNKSSLNPLRGSLTVMWALMGERK